MCGITGFFSYKEDVDTREFYQAHRKIAHRGPDDEGFIYKNAQGEIEHLRGEDTISDYLSRELLSSKSPTSLILGHRRLSIIDLSFHGHQPFVYDGLYLVYNGEIYNYLELRDELVTLGYAFETNSDTEVFLKAYHCWGEKAFVKFNGMWAAAIYDTNQDSIVLTRDRFGIKPLYYSTVDDRLLFGSEIKFVSSFFTHLQPNVQRVYDYLRFNYLNHTNETLFQDIFQIEPGSYLHFSKEGIKQVRYWHLKPKGGVDVREIENSLKEAVSLRMRADVEVGSLLSGGMDSSTILGIIDTNGYASEFQTFSAVFKEERFSEKSYIDKFATKRLTLKKHFIYPDPEKLVAEIDDLLYTQEEPFRSLAIYSQHEIYRYIKKHTGVKVLLNGQGADEIFTGYSEYHYIYLLELLRRGRGREFLKEFNAFAHNRNLSKTTLLKSLLLTFISLFYRTKDKYKIFKRDFQPPKFPKRFASLLQNGLWQNLSFSALREYLLYEDKNSMRYSLESRLPFLDVGLVERAYGLEDRYKIANGFSKVVLREIAKDKIPKEILERKDKMGFVSPQEIWQKTVLKASLDEAFEAIKEEGLFDFIDHRKLYEVYLAYQEGRVLDWPFIWRVYSLYRWKRVWGVR